MKRASISMRLTLSFGTMVLLGWLAFGVAMWLSLKHTLTEERHSTLTRRLERLQELLRQTGEESSAERQQDFKDFAHATGNGLSEVFRPDGSRALPSPSTAAKTFSWPPVKAGDHQVFRQIVSGGQPYWVLERTFRLGDEELILASAAPASGNILVLDRFLEGLLASVPVLLLVSLTGGYWLSRRALRPVDRITATARSIGIRNLAERLPSISTGDELERLSETFNAMLVRLESAVNQIKQFTGDASHELRGPLSFVRTVSEVALRNPDIDLQSREAFKDIVEETKRAAVLLEDMLTLARADAKGADTILVPVNLDEVVREACEMAGPCSQERGLPILLSLADSDPTRVLGDFNSLRRLFWILLDNALKYSQAPGKIDITLHSSTDLAIVVIRDMGCGIPTEDLPHIFDRFYRSDPSRSQVEGSGLGLSIAKWIADLHNATLSISSNVGHGTSVEFAIPTCSFIARLSPNRAS